MATNRLILIADDDLEVRTGAAELLDPTGLSVLLATCGAEALELARDRGPLALALLDLHMPDRTGLEVFDELRHEDPELPCILWSGDATEVIERCALKAGAYAFLHKPVRPELLRGAVCGALTSRWGLGQWTGLS